MQILKKNLYVIHLILTERIDLIIDGHSQSTFYKKYIFTSLLCGANLVILP
jgi:hypothetical protein